MLVKEDDLYFLTGRGKPFYHQLKSYPKIAICGMNANYVSAWIVGDIQFCNSRIIIDEIFEHNPMMNDLYPAEKRDILEGFYLNCGKGDIFDFSVEPPRRERFALGGGESSRLQDNFQVHGLRLVP